MTGPLSFSPETRALLFVEELTHAAHQAEKALRAYRRRNPGAEWVQDHEDLIEAQHALSCALSRVWPTS